MPERKLLALFLVILALSMIACLLTTNDVREACPSPTLHPTPTALDYRPATPTLTPTCEADYYRGIYTLCMVFNIRIANTGSTTFVDCDDLIKEASENHWYEKDAPGFEWAPIGINSVRQVIK